MIATLFAPASYWEATEAERAAVCNGCGTAGWKGTLVPDTIWGLSIWIACCIHDWMYHLGKSEADREEADRAFLNNMLRLIDEAGGVLRRFRRVRAYAYYRAVRRFGGPAFWDEKNPDATMGAVAV